jgi:hypothetical protein
MSTRVSFVVGLILANLRISFAIGLMLATPVVAVPGWPSDHRFERRNYTVRSNADFYNGEAKPHAGGTLNQGS